LPSRRGEQETHPRHRLHRHQQHRGNAISGTFGNLADGSTLTAGRNNLLVSYTGGDGNDLTLTVQ